MDILTLSTMLTLRKGTASLPCSLNLVGPLLGSDAQGTLPHLFP